MSNKLPDMPEIEPDDGDIERHDAHYRLNPKGHKELVVKKKGEPDEETLNELAESLTEMASEYAGLEDADEFQGPGQVCGTPGCICSDDLVPCEGCDAMTCFPCIERSGISDIRGPRDVCPVCAGLVEEDIAFGGPAPALSPEQQGYQRDFRPMTPSAASDISPTQNGHIEKRIAHSPVPALAADGPEQSRAKSKIRTSTFRGKDSKRGKRDYSGDGLDYGVTHSEDWSIELFADLIDEDL
jgi:hypothetical protein